MEKIIIKIANSDLATFLKYSLVIPGTSGWFARRAVRWWSLECETRREATCPEALKAPSEQEIPSCGFPPGKSNLSYVSSINRKTYLTEV